MNAFNSLGRFAPHLLGVLRIFTSLTFISHGTQKILAFPVAPSWAMPISFSVLNTEVLSLFANCARIPV